MIGMGLEWFHRKDLGINWWGFFGLGRDMGFVMGTVLKVIGDGMDGKG